MKLILHESVIGYLLVKIEIMDAKKKILPNSKIFNGDLENEDMELSCFSFVQFNSLEHSISNCQSLTLGRPTRFLIEFLNNSFVEEKNQIQLIIMDPTLSLALKDLVKVHIFSDISTVILSKIVRKNFEFLSKGIVSKNIGNAQKKIANLYFSRKIKDQKGSIDKFIIQTGLIIQNLDEDINFLLTTVKELYSLFFPGISQFNIETMAFCLIVNYIFMGGKFETKSLPDLDSLTLNRELSKKLFHILNEKALFFPHKFDLLILRKLGRKIISLMEMRKVLHSYLKEKVIENLPNLYFIIGEFLVFQLLAKAGSIRNLVKYPSSTLQIIGSEKALFKALKSHSNTPKYGVLYNSRFVLKSKPKNRSKISKYLSNKCSLAIKIDYFSKSHTICYGKKFRKMITGFMKNL